MEAKILSTSFGYIGGSMFTSLRFTVLVSYFLVIDHMTGTVLDAGEDMPTP